MDPLSGVSLFCAEQKPLFFNSKKFDAKKSDRTILLDTARFKGGIIFHLYFSLLINGREDFFLFFSNSKCPRMENQKKPILDSMQKSAETPLGGPGRAVYPSIVTPLWSGNPGGV